MGLTNQDIVCFANDWTADPTSKHHLMKRLAATNRVLWVEAAGMRSPRLGRRDDLRRIRRKLLTLTANARQRLPGLWSFAPPILPLAGWAMADRLNRRLYAWSIRRQLRRLGFDPQPMLWIYGPHVAPWIRDLRRRCLVYHCVDRWGAFRDYDAERMRRAEAEICRAAQVVLASAADLGERCRTFGATVHYVPHGVEHSHFAAALEPGVLPFDLARIPAPRIGFFGLIHEWVDTDLLATLAERLPYSFVLIGTSNQDLSSLLARRNVFHLGRRPYQELPDYCRGFDAAIVPFRLSELTRSVNPIKLREYAAAGLPIVASDLPEIRRCSTIATCVTGIEDWEGALRAAVARSGIPAERRAQSERVKDQDWGGVTERIGSLVARGCPTAPSSPLGP